MQLCISVACKDLMLKNWKKVDHDVVIVFGRQVELNKRRVKHRFGGSVVVR